MANPWEEISLDIYEKHMRLDSVRQLHTMNAMMKEQFAAYPVETAMILGVAVVCFGSDSVERQCDRMGIRFPLSSCV